LTSLHKTCPHLFVPYQAPGRKARKIRIKRIKEGRRTLGSSKRFRFLSCSPGDPFGCTRQERSCLKTGRQLMQILPAGLSNRKNVWGSVDPEGIVKNRHALVPENQIPVLEDLGPQAFRENLIHMADQILDMKPSSQQSGSRFRSNPGNSGNIVDAVPCQGQKVGNLVRVHSPLGSDIFRFQKFLGHGFIDMQTVRDKGQKILVRRKDDHAGIRLFRKPSFRQGGDGIVSFISVGRKERDSQIPDQLLDEGNLDNQLFWRRGAIGLEFGKNFGPEIAGPAFEDHSQITGFKGVEKGQEHVAEDGKSSRGNPGSGRKGNAAVIGPEDITEAIQKKQGTLRKKSHPFRRGWLAFG
jgi:hypothetical protein